jgi:hypothetical protein
MVITMVVASHSVQLEQPPEKVFAYVSDLQRYPEWARRVVAVEDQSPGPCAAGTSFRIVNRVLGRSVSVPYTVTVCEPPACLGFGGGTGLASAQFTFDLSPESGGTRFTERVDMTFRGLLRLAGRLISRLSQRQLSINHAYLQEAMRSTDKP